MAAAFRRSHHKSRDGCVLCKQRRVKCDEERPRCAACRRRKLECVYQDSTQINISPTKSESTSSDCFDIFDLELLTHFHSQVRSTLDADPTTPLRWAEQVQRPAFSHPLVVHAVLAISAIHLARQGETRRGLCEDRAIQHHTYAINSMIATLPKLDNMNADPLFLGSVLLCIYTFAAGPQLGQYLAFGDNGNADWIRLLKGVRSIILGSHGSVTGLMTNVRMSEPIKETDSSLEDALLEMQSLAAEKDDLANAVCSRAINGLKQCYIEAYRGNSIEQGIAESHHVFAWLYFLEPEYLMLLQSKHSLALIAFAYFDVLLHQLRHLWYLERWSLHIFEGISKCLAAEDLPKLQWPAEMLGRSES